MTLDAQILNALRAAVMAQYPALSFPRNWA